MKINRTLGQAVPLSTLKTGEVYQLADDAYFKPYYMKRASSPDFNAVRLETGYTYTHSGSTLVLPVRGYFQVEETP